MPRRTTHNRIREALVNGTEMRVRGVNMYTGERGDRYRVTAQGELYLWGNLVAHLRPTYCIVSTCGYNTETTRQAINTALGAYGERVGVTMPVVSVCEGSLNCGDVLWDGREATCTTTTCTITVGPVTMQFALRSKNGRRKARSAGETP